MNLITNILNSLGWYPTIFILMLLESTVVPVPSEFVVTPAAYHAASGSLNVFLVILFATIGADVGASINYFVALYVGRPVIYKFANSKWVTIMVSQRHLQDVSYLSSVTSSPSLPDWHGCTMASSFSSPLSVQEVGIVSWHS